MLEMDEHTVQLIALPLFHIGGLILALTSLLAGSVTILASNGDPRLMVKMIREERVSHLPTVPTLLASLLEEAESEPASLRSLRAICYGSAPMPEGLLQRAMSMLRADLLSGYGMTETTATVTFLQFHDHQAANRPDATAAERQRLKSAGRVGPGAEIMIVDPQTFDEVPPGCHGEVLVRGTQVMAGYWDRHHGNADVVSPQGWIRTGDGGYIDEDGYLFLTDRIKDMIITGGENVYPAEIEAVVADMPGIVEAAVIGVPDDRWGETPKLFAVRTPGAVVTEMAIMNKCRNALAHFKCPSAVQWVDELPRNASGKVLKHILRQQSRDSDKN